MELSAWLSLATICVLGAMSPGPSLAVMLKHCLNGGTFNGIIAAISHGLSVGVYAIATIIGLSALVIKYPILYQVLVYGGAAYLLYMGFKALTAKASPFNMDAKTGEKTTIGDAIKDSAAIAILNPKLAVFFTALFSQFITSETANLFTSAIMVATVASIDIIWYIIVALIIGFAKTKIEFDKHSNIIDKVSGLVFIGLAVRVVTL